ncbi:hypothetical protein [Brevundimonas sp.]|uniref:hypothetical protein n=1 Tax=Brevundimonas sp. TaxID=1871086 RepID=UPI00289E8A4B|nr:hypothetical protein [Brevundimonas sp.]
MRSLRCLMLPLVLVASLSLVSGCASKDYGTQIFPPLADLQVEAKPQLDPAAVESEAALDAHDIALEVWGERGWATVARLCRWHVEMGMKGLSCPKRTAAPP